MGESTAEQSLTNKQVGAFYQVSSFINTIDDLGLLLELIMREAEAAVDAEASCIALYDPSDNLLHVEFASGAKSTELRNLSLALGEGVLGHVAATNTTICVDDVRVDSRFEPSVDRKIGFKTRCILATPICHLDARLGVLEVVNKRGGFGFTDEDARLLEIVASQAAIAIENARLLQRIVQSERLSLVGKMATSIAHDMRNPLAVIGGYADLLGSSEIAPEQRRSYSDRLKQATCHLGGMAQELLDYTRGTIHLRLEEIQLGDWLERSIEFLQEDFAVSGIEVVIDQGYQGSIWIDAERMHRVVINLASNARDAMSKGGTLNIATRREGDYWELLMRDTGCGVPAELGSKIFEPFVTTGKEHGTGLGLAIVREIVERHGGVIQLRSSNGDEVGNENSGTTFLIRLPITPPLRSDTQEEQDSHEK